MDFYSKKSPKNIIFPLFYLASKKSFRRFETEFINSERKFPQGYFTKF